MIRPITSDQHFLSRLSRISEILSILVCLRRSISTSNTYFNCKTVSESHKSVLWWTQVAPWFRLLRWQPVSTTPDWLSIVSHGRQRLQHFPLVDPFSYLLITKSVERHIILGPRISMNSLDTNLKYIERAESKKLGFHPWVKPGTYLWRCVIFVDCRFRIAFGLITQSRRASPHWPRARAACLSRGLSL